MPIAPAVGPNKNKSMRRVIYTFLIVSQIILIVIITIQLFDYLSRPISLQHPISITKEGDSIFLIGNRPEPKDVLILSNVFSDNYGEGIGIDSYNKDSIIYSKRRFSLISDSLLVFKKDTIKFNGSFSNEIDYFDCNNIFESFNSKIMVVNSGFVKGYFDYDYNKFYLFKRAILLVTVNEKETSKLNKIGVVIYILLFISLMITIIKMKKIITGANNGG